MRYMAPEEVFSQGCSGKGGVQVSLFYDWLMEQTERSDEVGDLARDAASDPEFPSDPRPLVRYHDYLRAHQAPPVVHAALDRAWREWSRT